MNKFVKIKIKGKTVTVDKEMENIILLLNKNKNIETLGCCSGHKIYPQTIVARISPYPIILEIFSNTEIPRKKRYYVSDKDGFYFIPEVMEKLKK